MLRNLDEEKSLQMLGKLASIETLVLHPTRANRIGMDWFDDRTGMHRLLVIEDSPEVSEAIRNALATPGYEVRVAETLAKATALMDESSFDLILLDIMLPDGDGFDWFSRFCKKEGHQDVPVLFLTARNDISLKVAAFTLGAEDYIIKPFHLRELQARIESKLRKNSTKTQAQEVLNAGPIRLFLGSQRCQIPSLNQTIDLTSREFKILTYLIQSQDQIRSREQILSMVLSQGVHVTERTIDTHVCALRRKLGKFAVNLETIPGIGYRFNPSKTARPSSSQKTEKKKS